MIGFLNKRKRFIATFFLGVIVLQLSAVPSYALTSGPSQPEVQGFQPAGTSDMVDLFTGDFSYNIPLFELPGPNGGYPFNLSYQAGLGMDAEASWVGLGFSLNPGAINRQMRGLPDEFSGDAIKTKMAIEPSVTVGLGAGVSLERFGAAKDRGSIGLTVNYNNYNGFGYSIDGNVGYSHSVAGGLTHGLGFSLDPKQGVSLSPSLGLSKKALGTFGLRADYNSKTGLQSISATHSMTTYAITQNKETNSNTSDTDDKKTENEKTDPQVEVTPFGSVGHSSAGLTLSHPGYTPQVSMPMRNVSMAARFAPGAAMWGFFANGYVKGFYSEQWLKDNKKWTSAKAYGYLNYQNATNASAVLDFNREKDGLITKNSPNLPIPSLTYDVYSVTGQGISAMYRPMRNDRGIVHDPETISKSVGASIGVDAAPGLAHVGVNLTVNHAKSTSSKWTDNNNALSSSAFQSGGINDTYEPVYFKVHGENTPQSNTSLDAIGGDKAVRVAIPGDNINAVAANTLERTNWSKTMPNSATTDRERKTRAQLIQTITNEELTANGKELISHLKVRYQTAAGVDTTFDRSRLPKHHIAAFTALTPEGLRYNYGIPAYNLKQEETSFTGFRAQNDSKVLVNKINGNPCGSSGDPCYEQEGTEKFLKRVDMPKYAHAYLLTSIIGPDYVDITGDGVSADDLGYWVKFTYRKTADESSAYKWRDPFSKAHYSEGWKTDPRDDRGSFVYGEKEMWYLVKAETKSHIATFSLEEREDGRGVNKLLQDQNETGKAIYKLNEIKLFSRIAGTSKPIKTVKFDYDYSLCPGVDNSITGNGKLTLRKVWFEYGSNTRGKFNPYVFSYHQHNPAYDQHAYDRWGNYKPYPVNDPLYNIDYPYVEQDPAKKDQIDQNAAAWSLTEIQLPSGGKIKVDYESDDYAYVQHMQAMQMMDIVSPQGNTSGEFTLDDNSRVYFKLERPVPESAISGDEATRKTLMKNEVMKYLDKDREQVYIKALINVRSEDEDFYEYISMYVKVDFSANGTMELHKAGGSNYVYGSFKLVKEEDVNPLSLRTWQHLRINQPELASSDKKLTNFKQTDKPAERVKQITALGSLFDNIKTMFAGYYDFCNDAGFGREMMAGKSWVRLNSPDKIKYGGGLRVRQVTMIDNWTEDKEGVYGQVYDYSMTEDNNVISSGVAAYEPMVGGDEIPLRYAKRYVQSVSLRSDNNLFFEFPVNESSYPGPQVGYRKVTVTSLAAANLAGQKVKHNTLENGKTILPKSDGKISYGTSGVTVHEFFTAKDFPVITDETEKVDKPYQLSVPIPFLGNVSVNKLTTSQGYSMITNDMHGKQKMVSTYRQNRQGGIEPKPISWVKYNYFSESQIYQKQNVSVLSATFKDNNDGSLSIASKAEVANPAVAKYSIGQEHEFFLDMRQHEDNAWEGGANINIEMLLIVTPLGTFMLPAFVPWPSVGVNAQQLRSSVANKLIFRTGILQSVEAYDGGSTVITQNVKWDKYTGGVLLTKVNNNFDAPLYSYNIPAYTQYQGMGAAFQNIGLKFSIADVTKDYVNNSLYTFKATTTAGNLVPGDEILLYSTTGGWNSPKAKIVFAGEENGEMILYSPEPLPASSYNAMIVRSGYRNHLNVSAGSITGLEDPSQPGVSKSYTKVVSVPNE
ncbi:MAG TPA: hypothetical protein VGK59_03520 [Ohtaekwangia sp.]